MNEELSREQILDLADAQGRKLGFLLATSPLDDDIKNAIINILEEATPEQLDKLTEALESGYLQARTQDLNNFLKTELEIVKTEFDLRQKNLETKTLRKLDKF